jgi:serine protease Do
VGHVVEKLKSGGTVARGFIGVQIQPVNDEIAESLGLPKAEGALVGEAQPGTPGEKAGLKPGDVITKLNGDTIAAARDLSRRVGDMDPGTKVKLTYVRDGKENTVDVTLGTLPEQKQAAVQPDEQEEDQGGSSSVKLGIQVAPASRTPGAGDQGLVVTQVDPDGSAAGKLTEGDVILEAGGKTVNSSKDVVASLDAAQKAGRKAVLLRVKNGDNTRFVAIEIGRG